VISLEPLCTEIIAQPEWECAAVAVELLLSRAKRELPSTRTRVALFASFTWAA